MSTPLCHKQKTVRLRSHLALQHRKQRLASIPGEYLHGFLVRPHLDEFTVFAPAKDNQRRHVVRWFCPGRCGARGYRLSTAGLSARCPTHVVMTPFQEPGTNAKNSASRHTVLTGSYVLSLLPCMCAWWCWRGSAKIRLVYDLACTFASLPVLVSLGYNVSSLCSSACQT
jgi:hypothetical protein